jgi:hypothetical protein
MTSTDFEQITRMKEFTFADIAQLLIWIEQRNHYIKSKLQHHTGGIAADEDFIYGMIEQCNKHIKTILQLT